MKWLRFYISQLHAGGNLFMNIKCYRFKNSFWKTSIRRILKNSYIAILSLLIIYLHPDAQKQFWLQSRLYILVIIEHMVIMEHRLWLNHDSISSPVQVGPWFPCMKLMPARGRKEILHGAHCYNTVTCNSRTITHFSDTLNVGPYLAVQQMAASPC